MPTLLYLNGFRFFFYSNENNEPIHLHVSKGKALCKIWMEPEIELAYSMGFNNKELNFILETVNSCESDFKNKWNEHFRK